MFLATFPTPLLDALHSQRRAQAELARQQVLQSALTWLTEQGHRFGITQGYLWLRDPTGKVLAPFRR